MSVRKFYLLQCPASTLVSTYEDCHRHAENVTFALLREYSVSLTSLLELKCALQLPQALLGSRRLLFDLLLLFVTNSLTGALKSSCVISSIDPWKNHWVLQLACKEGDFRVVERVLHFLYSVPMLLVFHAPESVQLLGSECTANTELHEGQVLEFSLSSLYLLSYQVFPS